LQSAELCPSDFMSYFLNFLRDQASVILHECSVSSGTTPSKSTVPVSKLCAVQKSANLVDSSSSEPTPVPTELFKTPDSVGQIINRTQHQKSVYSGSWKKHGTPLASTDASSSSHERCTTDVRYQTQGDCGNTPSTTPKIRYQRSNLLSDFITPKASGDVCGKSLFGDGKRPRGKSKVVPNRQDTSRKVQMNAFSLGSDMDFPEMDSSAVSRYGLHKLHLTLSSERVYVHFNLFMFNINCYVYLVNTVEHQQTSFQDWLIFASGAFMLSCEAGIERAIRARVLAVEI